jgi:hypothetical protein
MLAVVAVETGIPMSVLAAEPPDFLDEMIAFLIERSKREQRDATEEDLRAKLNGAMGRG